MSFTNLKMFTKEELETIQEAIRIQEDGMYDNSPELIYGHETNGHPDQRSNNEAWYQEVTTYRNILSKIDKKLVKLAEV